MEQCIDIIKVGDIVKPNIGLRTGQFGRVVDVDDDAVTCYPYAVLFDDGVTMYYTKFDLSGVGINSLDANPTPSYHEEFETGDSVVTRCTGRVGEVLTADVGFGDNCEHALVKFDGGCIALVETHTLTHHKTGIDYPKISPHYTVALGNSYTPNVSDAKLVDIYTGDSLTSILDDMKSAIDDSSTSAFFWVKIHTTYDTGRGHKTTSITKPIRISRIVEIVD